MQTPHNAAAEASEGSHPPSKQSTRGASSIGGRTPGATSFRLEEGLPTFFMATDPSPEQLQAFKDFAANAEAIRHEIAGKQAAEAKAKQTEVPIARAKSSLLGRTFSRAARSGTAPALGEAARARTDAAHATSPAFPGPYPEVPELAGSYRLLRFLQGSDYDVSTASDAYRRHMKWRQEIGLSAKRRRAVVEMMLVPMRPEAAPRHADVCRFYPTNPVLRSERSETPSSETLAAASATAFAPGDCDSLLKAMSSEALDSVLLDKQGNIISVERPGQVDINGLFAAVPEEEFLRWHSYLLEFRCMLLDVLSRKFNRMVRTTSIVDLQGLSARMLSRRTLNLLQRTIGAASENYPESISTMYFINTPRTFSTVWSAMRGWLREKTVNKIVILGSDAETVLPKHVGGYALPPWLGGNCMATLADIPTKEEDRVTDLGPGCRILNVAARKCNQAVEIVPKKSVARWVWVAEDFDVGFSALWRSQSGTEFILEEHRKYPARKRVSGAFKAEQEGSLILSFDNSWGLISARRVRYKIEIKPFTPGAQVRSRAGA